MPTLPENQLRQARALLQDIRKFMTDQTKGHHPLLDYRMVDVFRGLELAEKGLSALIDEKHYTELEALQEAFRGWENYVFTDEEIKGSNEPGN